MVGVRLIDCGRWCPERLIVARGWGGARAGAASAWQVPCTSCFFKPLSGLEHRPNKSPRHPPSRHLHLTEATLAPPLPPTTPPPPNISMSLPSDPSAAWAHAPPTCFGPGAPCTQCLQATHHGCASLAKILMSSPLQFGCEHRCGIVHRNKLGPPRTVPLSSFVQQTAVRARTGDEDPIPEEAECTMNGR